MLTGHFGLHELLLALFLLVLIWPGYSDVEPLEAPKKGYWTAASIFWPLRRAYRTLWPADVALAKPMQASLRLALVLVGVAGLASQFWTAATEVMDRGGAAVVLVAAALLVGRASGFWSADRRIARLRQIKEGVAAEAQVRAADLP